MKNIIETFDLTKIYQLKGQNKEIKALDNINISVKEGEIFGFIGPNGAGKSNIIDALCFSLGRLSKKMPVNSRRSRLRQEAEVYHYQGSEPVREVRQAQAQRL